MTIGELTRCFESKARKRESDAREKASMDYVLADLIGRSIARLYSQDAHYPEIYDVYPSLFEKEKVESAKQAERDRLSALRVQQWAEAFMKKQKGGHID